MAKNPFILLVLFLVIAPYYMGQTVGVVLSGGGASGLAHVGFLKALEENNIPIDYITGTSMGAVIAAFYAAGYSVDEIEAFITSEKFRQMSRGELDERLNFHFKDYDADASMITTKHSKGEFINSSLPTKLINPVMMDMLLMEKLSPASAAANYDFDQLFIPYRCVASNIEDKELIVFKQGNLSLAARASASYPFYIPPVHYHGKLLYDGGIYNNFPSDILYKDFMPDVILGNNVSGNIAPPNEDDLFSQLENMIRHKTNFLPLCQEMIVLKPKVAVGTFDFDLAKTAVEEGYSYTLTHLDSILKIVHRNVSEEELKKKRENFRAKFRPIEIGKIEIEGVNAKQKKYIAKILGKNDESIPLDKFKTRFFRIFADDKIESVFPEVIYDKVSDNYTMKLRIKNEKDLFVSFGGNFSSRPINMGFLSARYNFFGKTSSSIYANSYFGKFYGSLHTNYRLDFAGNHPFSIQPEFTFNRWDYFKSFATFFEDVKPSFIISNERFGGMKFVFPMGNKGKITLLPEYTYIDNQYYQTEDFLPSDTSDRTIFEGQMYSATYDRNTLNRKYFASKGTHLSFKAKFSNGVEHTIPGSTAVFEEISDRYINWLTFRLKYINYFKSIEKLQLGLHLEGVTSNQPFFNNYKASVLMAPTFKPIPESNTFFIPKHHAYNFASAGLITILSPWKNFDIRGEAYAFRPFGQLEADANNHTQMNFEKQYYFLGSGSLIYHTPLGPVSLSANFYDFKENPWSFAFNFGYMIFNRSAKE